jgi:hypothetical protein
MVWWRRGTRKIEPADLQAREGLEATRDEDEEWPLVPPQWERVLQRTQVLLAVALHGEISLHYRDEQSGADEVRSQLEATGAWDEAEAAERALLNKPIAEWTDQEGINSLWRYEGAAVLAWWLGRLALPTFDQQVDAGSLVSCVRPWGEVLTPQAIPAAAHSAADLERLFTQLLTVHWRLTDQRINPRHADFAALVQGAWWGPLSLDGVDLSDGDLAVNGVRLIDADPEQVRLASSTVIERRLAVAWLRGEDPLYSEGSLDT